MKTKSFLLAVTVLMLSGMASAQSAQNNALTLANVAVQPNPVVAGGNVTVLFQLYNSYDSSLNDINVQLTGSYPLLNFSPASTYLISSMGVGLSSGFFTYRLHLPNTTASGTYTLNFVANYHTSTFLTGTVVGTSTMPLSFYVNGVPNITAVAATAQIVPGKAFVLYLHLLNSGYDTAKSVVIRSLNTSNFTPYGVSVLNIGTLPIGAMINASTSYQASRAIGNGTYTIPISVSYRSGLGVQYNKTINLQASVVISSPEIRLSFSNPIPQALYQGYNQTVQLKIENTGSGIAKNVSVYMQAGQGLSVLSSVDNFFIGELQPGQAVYEPVLLAARGSNNSSITARIRYYSADYGNSFSALQTLNLSLAPAAQFSVVGVGSSLVPGSTNIPITFKIKNTGSSDARELQFSLQSTYPITPVAGTYFVTDLQPGTSANITFLVSADSQGLPGNYPVILYEQWRQPNGATNQQFSGSNNYFVVVNESGGGLSGTIAAIVVVVIVIAAVYLFVKRFRNRAKSKGK